MSISLFSQKRLKKRSFCLLKAMHAHEVLNII